MRPCRSSTRQRRPERQQRDGECADQGSQDQRAAEREVALIAVGRPRLMTLAHDARARGTTRAALRLAPARSSCADDQRKCFGNWAAIPSLSMSAIERIWRWMRS